MTPRIYVACLAAYNNGKLHGAWIDAAQGTDVDPILEEVRAMLAASPVPGAEEWAIHDSEGFGAIKISEHENLTTVAVVATLLDRHGEAFAAFWSNDPDQDAEGAGDRFEEAYQGTWRSLEEYAEEYLNDTGMLDKLPENLRSYFDYESFARDLELGGDVWTADTPDGVAVFQS